MCLMLPCLSKSIELAPVASAMTTVHRYYLVLASNAQWPKIQPLASWGQIVSTTDGQIKSPTEWGYSCQVIFLNAQTVLYIRVNHLAKRLILGNSSQQKKFMKLKIIQSNGHKSIMIIRLTPNKAAISVHLKERRKIVGLQSKVSSCWDRRGRKRILVYSHLWICLPIVIVWFTHLILWGANQWDCHTGVRIHIMWLQISLLYCS